LRGGFPFATQYARDNPVYRVHIAPIPDLPVHRPPDRLPSTMAALAAIPEEEI
jgi:hypothetical protein